VKSLTIPNTHAALNGSMVSVRRLTISIAAFLANLSIFSIEVSVVVAGFDNGGGFFRFCCFLGYKKYV